MKDLVRLLRQTIRRGCSEERGVALVVVAGSMVALTSAVALAVDVGMLTMARTQAQSAADGAALAGASALITNPDGAGLARLRAIDFAGRNAIRGQAADVEDGDITVDLAARTVGVHVARTEERGNPIGTFFARIFGVEAVDITAFAKARASNAASINCVLPLAVPDQWEEAGGAGNPPDEFNPELGDRYIPFMDTSTDPPTFNDEFTGYSDSDIGEEIILTTNEGGGILHPGWYNAWRPPGQSGGDDFRENISRCVDPTITYSFGQTVYTEQGNMDGPTGQGFRDLINQDPDAVWNGNDGMKCVTDMAYKDHINAPEHCRDSPRIRPIPMFDPRYPPEPGHNPFDLMNFAGVFVEEIRTGQNKGEFVARWMGLQGMQPASEQGPGVGPLPKVVQLID